MSFGFKHKCGECGCLVFQALTSSLDEETVDALKCDKCGEVKEVSDGE